MIHKNRQTVTVTAVCAVAGRPYSVTVPRDAWDRWCAGELIQSAMPDVPPEDREFLVSGTSPEGWNMLFPNGDE